MYGLKEGFKFDAIYTGYIGTLEQIDIVSDYFKTFNNPHGYIIVDPAMADNGKLYTGFDMAFAKKMTTLCSDADIILPNISEAAFITNTPYPGEDASVDEIKAMLLKLANLGPKIAVITGVHIEPNRFGYIGYNTESQTFFQLFYQGNCD
mgnify:FL=1